MKLVVRTCACAISLTIWIHIAMFGSLSLFFRDRSSSSYFSRKLFKFGAYANSLDHSDCSHGELALFYNLIFISGCKFLSLSMKAVVGTCSCVISLDHFDLRLFMFGSHSRNQNEFTVSFISRKEFNFLFFEKAVRIWGSLCEFS